MPLLKAMGVDSKTIQEAWGKTHFNFNADDAAEFTKLKSKFLVRKN